ncbi:stress responsive A/B barrel domain protein [Mycena filopes]|nr:stress responsive A/B barrel domain protein [Mycena filopes]
MPGIVHIVMFAFEPSATPEQVQEVCDGMLALKDNCLHPQTTKPYIMTASGGKNNSAEGLHGDFKHAFVSRFENEEDRDYYVNKDPAHQEFVKSISGIVSKAQVVDYMPGVF